MSQILNRNQRMKHQNSNNEFNKEISQSKMKSYGKTLKIVEWKIL